MMKITFAVAAAAAVLTTAPLVTPAKAQGVKMAQFRSGGTATTATIGTVAGGTTPTPQLASAQVVSPSANNSAATETTTIERDDGRRITRRERRCD
jgi:hypothetical protein